MEFPVSQPNQNVLSCGDKRAAAAFVLPWDRYVRKLPVQAIITHHL